MSGNTGDEMSPGGAVRDRANARSLVFFFLLWFVPALERFPRRQKFLLGDRIRSTALDVLESLIEATYTGE